MEQLDLADQVRLLEYLTPRIAGAVLASRGACDAEDAWRRFRDVGRRLAATSAPGGATLTDAVSHMRR